MSLSVNKMKLRWLTWRDPNQDLHTTSAFQKYWKTVVE